SGDEVEQGALASAVRANDGVSGAGGELDADRVQRGEPTESAADLVQVQQGGHRRLPTIRVCHHVVTGWRYAISRNASPSRAREWPTVSVPSRSRTATTNTAPATAPRIVPAPIAAASNANADTSKCMSAGDT